MSDWLTVADVGRAVGLTPDTVRWLANTGRLRVGARTQGGLRLFRREAVEEYLEVRRRRAASRRRSAA